MINLFQASKCFERTCSSSGGQKLYYTVSGIITSIGGRPVHGTATYVWEVVNLKSVWRKVKLVEDIGLVHDLS